MRQSTSPSLSQLETINSRFHFAAREEKILSCDIKCAFSMPTNFYPQAHRHAHVTTQGGDMKSQRRHMPKNILQPHDSLHNGVYCREGLKICFLLSHRNYLNRPRGSRGKTVVPKAVCSMALSQGTLSERSVHARRCPIQALKPTQRERERDGPNTKSCSCRRQRSRGRQVGPSVRRWGKSVRPKL